MQKHFVFSLSLILAVLFYADAAKAAIQYLPRYQSNDNLRSKNGGRDKTIITCATYSYLTDKNPLKSCKKVIISGGSVCWKCSDCDADIYKYTCSGDGFHPMQDDSLLCGDKYSDCRCLPNFVKREGQCVCEGDDYIFEAGNCSLKGCSDYGYYSQQSCERLQKVYPEKMCQEVSNSNIRSGLSCYELSCDSSYQYACDALKNDITRNIKGGNGTSCNNKYKSCSCTNNLYSWNSSTMSCSAVCTAKSCEGSGKCGNYPCYLFTETNSKPEGAGEYYSCSPVNCNGEGYKYGYIVLSCLPGYALKNDYTGCTKCAPGTYAATALEEKCSACPAGTYNPDGNGRSCTACPENMTSSAGSAICSCGSQYKYTCSGSGFHPIQDENLLCGDKYSDCRCLPNFVKREGQCVCEGDDYIFEAGNCSLKGCSDYSSSYYDEAVCKRMQSIGTEGKVCQVVNDSRIRAGLACYQLGCDSKYKYTCTGSGYSGGSGSSCGGKYESCGCSSTHKWNGSACISQTCEEQGKQNCQGSCIETYKCCNALGFTYLKNASDEALCPNGFKCDSGFSLYRTGGCVTCQNSSSADEPYHSPQCY